MLPARGAWWNTYLHAQTRVQNVSRGCANGIEAHTFGQLWPPLFQPVGQIPGGLRRDHDHAAIQIDIDDRLAFGMCQRQGLE